MSADPAPPLAEGFAVLREDGTFDLDRVYPDHPEAWAATHKRPVWSVLIVPVDKAAEPPGSDQ